MTPRTRQRLEAEALRLFEELGTRLDLGSGRPAARAEFLSDVVAPLLELRQAGGPEPRDNPELPRRKERRRFP